MPRITVTDGANGREGRLSRQDAAAYLGVAVSTMADWHRRGLGPASVMVGGRRFYRMSALNDFIEKAPK